MRDAGLDGYRKKWGQDGSDAGQRIHYCWDAGQVGCQVWRDAVQEGYRIGQEKCWTEIMQDRRDAGQEGCSLVGLQDRRDTGVMQESRDSG